MMYILNMLLFRIFGSVNNYMGMITSGGLLSVTFIYATPVFYFQ